MNHIEVRAVTKTFDRHTVLDNVSLSVAKGRCIGLVGANGSGKTMLMRCICGFVLPDKGEVYVDGKQILSLYGYCDRSTRLFTRVFRLD